MAKKENLKSKSLYKLLLIMLYVEEKFDMIKAKEVCARYRGIIP